MLEMILTLVEDLYMLWDALKRVLGYKSPYAP